MYLTFESDCAANNADSAVYDADNAGNDTDGGGNDADSTDDDADDGGSVLMVAAVPPATEFNEGS